MATKWVEIFVRRPEAPRRLICFHHAGGGAQFFRDWASRLPENWEVCAVQLPGRWARLREEPFRRMQPLVQAAAGGLAEHLDRPFAFFGHSLGALIAFETTRELRRLGKPLPIHLFASGRVAPQHPVKQTGFYSLPDSEFIEKMQQRYGAFPAEVVQTPELLEILLPAMRADMEVFDTYQYIADAPLNCPATVLIGDRDPVATAQGVQAWDAQTAGQLDLEVFQGAHFFMNEDQPRFFEFLGSKLVSLGQGR